MVDPPLSHKEKLADALRALERAAFRADCATARLNYELRILHLSLQQLGVSLERLARAGTEAKAEQAA